MGKVDLNIEIDPELLSQAKKLGVSVVGLSETQLRLLLQKIDPAGAEARARRWAEENAEAIKEHNERIERRGLISDHFRRW
ncbi:type II toxin-antitoxin system CcdA family antitoxin [Caulobacter segnis]|uniref:type II toxin-antitoxin system CcdA family antitoxin n=1 Tax=Caulobacter segnis TaxID=88688 RepID=UPI0024101BC7|nr:type II toxin-antitoxin system CcdA family antitoxin [Caulobacter segnis]MDG2522770.1 type II toxin-antitoxin system CcdA family antitoxin [Caulobacter segnis]